MDISGEKGIKLTVQTVPDTVRQKSKLKLSGATVSDSAVEADFFCKIFGFSGVRANMPAFGLS